MSVAIDRALMALSLDEEDESFIMSDTPGFSAAERNTLSIMGKTLNPECQKIANLIRNMSRKWGKIGKCRGIALSKETFQFIFDFEHDLQEVLDKGAQTFDDWTIVLERWVEVQPEGYLQFIPLWVRISRIPVNYYTVDAIEALGWLIGEVKEVAFDPAKSQIQNYVRVKVMFEVSKPLRMSKVVQLPGGSSTVIHFNYEKLQKRCYSCQRLNHDKSICPISELKRKESLAQVHPKQKDMVIRPSSPILKESDPLFGVLAETQVGLSSTTGRPKIAKEVLDEMRNYLLAANGDDFRVRIERIKSSVAAAEKDLVANRFILRLEQPIIISTNVNKDKGIVFDYDMKDAGKEIAEEDHGQDKLMAATIKASRNEMRRSNGMVFMGPSGFGASSSNTFVSNLACSTVYSFGLPNPSLSGTNKVRPKARKRPSKSNRKPSRGVIELGIMSEENKKGKAVSGLKKRKVPAREEEDQAGLKPKFPKVVPREGSPNA